MIELLGVGTFDGYREWSSDLRGIAVIPHFREKFKDAIVDEYGFWRAFLNLRPKKVRGVRVEKETDGYVVVYRVGCGPDRERAVETCVFDRVDQANEVAEKVAQACNRAGLRV